jgi:sortase A
MAARRGTLRAFLRFVASVLLTSGTLLVADAAVTLLWQEPISAAVSYFQQRDLKEALEKPPKRVRERRPLAGDAIGRIELPSLDRGYYMVEGTKKADLRKGPGHYADTPLPGERGTVGVAGHRTTYGAPFRTIDKLRPGNRVVLEMTYGTFVYRVEKTRIVDPSEVSVKRRVRYDRLILSACHPLYSAAQRVVVFARFVRREAARVKRD